MLYWTELLFSAQQNNFPGEKWCEGLGFELGLWGAGWGRREGLHMTVNWFDGWWLSIQITFFLQHLVYQCLKCGGSPFTKFAQASKHSRTCTQVNIQIECLHTGILWFFWPWISIYPEMVGFAVCSVSNWNLHFQRFFTFCVCLLTLQTLEKAVWCCNEFRLTHVLQWQHILCRHCSLVCCRTYQRTWYSALELLRVFVETKEKGNLL